ncbi:MAG: hypothetical protein L3K14_03130 [Thermoplasmata archaeon]|nr:hypothetical protein [Thermoplasmata archaeon]
MPSNRPPIRAEEVLAVGVTDEVLDHRAPGPLTGHGHELGLGSRVLRVDERHELGAHFVRLRGRFEEACG